MATYKVFTTGGLLESDVEWLGGVFDSEGDAIRFAESEYERLTDECSASVNSWMWQSIAVEVVEVGA